MDSKTPARTLVLMVGVLLATPVISLTGLGDSIAGTLEDYTAVNNGLPTSGEFLFCTAGDVNGDGYDDIAASASNNSQQSTVLGIRVYTCKGGTSWEDNSTGLPTVDRYGGIGLGDVDGDGDLDIVAGVEVAEGSSNAGITVYINNGTVGGRLSWAEGPSPASTGTYMMVIFADVNADGDLDIVAACHSRGVKVWTGNGGSGGTLSFTDASTGLPTSGDYTGITVGDMNRDGDADIVACDYMGGIELHLWTGNGAGSWTSRDSSFPSGSEASMGVAVGDVNADGHGDIVYGRRDNGVKCLLGNSGGTSGSDFCWTAANTGLPTANRYSMVALADADIDGDLDLLAACDGQGMQLYIGNGGAGGTMGWALADVGLPGGQFYGVDFGDFNKDRVLDVVGSRYQRRGVGGVEAWRGTVLGASFPTARACWNGTEANGTTVVLGETVTLDGRPSFDAEDAPDGDVTGANLTYEWNLTSRPSGSVLTEANLTPDGSSATPSFAPDAVGNYTFTLAVRDSDLHWSIDEAVMELEVLKANLPPVADAGPDLSAVIGSHVQLDGTTSHDPDGEIVAWQWNASPSNPAPLVLEGANTSLAQFDAPASVGTYGFTLAVLDDNGSWSAEDLVEVELRLPPNEPPVAVASAPQVVHEGETVLLNGSLSHDPDGEVVAWRWNCTSHPGLLVNGSDAAEARAVLEEAGTYVMGLRVMDDRGDWSPVVTVTILVLPMGVNAPPTAVIAGAPLIVTVVNVTLRLDGSGSNDVDGTIAWFLWNCTSHPGATFSGQGSSSIEFTPPDEGDYVFTLGVMDDNGSWSVQEAMVTLRALDPPPPPPPPPPNKAPVAVIVGPAGPVAAASHVHLDWSGSYDEDGELLDHTWECTSHAGIAFGVINESVALFIPWEAGEYVIELLVMDDNYTWSEPANLTVNVVQPNQRPLVTITDPLMNGDVDLSSGVLHVEWTLDEPEGDDVEFTLILTLEFDILVEREGIGGTTRAIDIPLAWPVVEGGETLTLLVTARETSTTEELSGLHIIVFSVSNVANLPPPGPEPEPGVSDVESTDLLWLILVVIAVAVAVVVVVIVVVPGQDRGYTMGTPPPVYVGQVATTCPVCGGPVGTDNAFGQPYCPECDRYMD